MAQICQVCGHPAPSGYRWGARYDRVYMACLNWLSKVSAGGPIPLNPTGGKPMAGEQQRAGRQPVIRGEQHQEDQEQHEQQAQQEAQQVVPKVPQSGSGKRPPTTADQGGQPPITGATWPDVVMAVISAGWAAADVIKLVQAIAGANLDEE